MPGRRIATVLMLDVVGSTHVAAELGDARYRELSSRFNRLVRASLKRFDGKEEAHAGDGFFATFLQPDQACDEGHTSFVPPTAAEQSDGVS